MSKGGKDCTTSNIPQTKPTEQLAHVEGSRKIKKSRRQVDFEQEDVVFLQQTCKGP